MENKYTVQDLEYLLEKEILSLDDKSKPLIYQMREGKMKVYYAKRVQKYCYTIKGMGIEERDTAPEILNCIKGYLNNQTGKSVKHIFKTRKTQ
jgi:hypothetical protein